MKKQPLARYLNYRYFVVFGLLISAFTSLITYMNLSGIDDTIEYYIFYEAEMLTEYYQPYDDIAEFHPGFKEYYWGEKQLPALYSRLLDKQQFPPDEMSFYVEQEQYIYALPFTLPEAGVTFYVLHIFPFDEYEENNLSQRVKLSYLAFAVFLLLLYLVYRLNRQVTEQVVLFDRWMSDISDQSSNAFPDKKIPTRIWFKELFDAASRLQNSLQNQYKLRQIEELRVKREKDFLSSLSHELRTPISVIAAAIAVLRKHSQLSDKDQKVLDKLARANGNMNLMTSTLLQVWRKQKSANNPVTLSLAKKLEELIQEREIYCSASIEFNLSIVSQARIKADVSLVEITLGNLIRNACQYTANDQVELTVEQNSVRVSNAFEQEFQHQGLNYGYGFGLYLVETICKQQDWQLKVETQQEQFVVEVVFNQT